MLIFLDTKFTDLIQPELLSIGMAAEDLQELYVELDLATPEGQLLRDVASDFVKHGPVLEQWGRIPGATVPVLEMGRRAGQWLLKLHEEHQEPLTIAFNYSTDYELLGYATRDAGLWEQVREFVQPQDVDRLISTIEGELATEAAFQDIAKHRNLRRHHSLADALALRAAYEAVRASIRELQGSPRS